ncbi:site-specific integrase [Sediminicoccus sp. KRV36]|uniref:tyrosine-type recombinase/integrase n=1 Tax=Sediminicoccus sp. KRV36 TaxID=3133721 RepID=UPI00200D78EF|nr:site-specific integrase [Sediminicoccus rosea]UPY39213.1 tyrosine-type recombinase/integrase [Sediminicoccus rosea]
MTMITDRELKSCSRTVGRYSVGDGSGLSLLVRDSAKRAPVEGGGGEGDDDKRKQWVQRITVAGKVREIGHGAYPAVSLAKARAAAKKVVEEVKGGADPLAQRRDKEGAAKAAIVQTFDAALTAYIEAHGAAWRSEKTRTAARVDMERHASSLLPKPVRDIRVSDVLAVLQPIWNTKPIMAQRVRARMEAILDWAKGAGWRSGENPAAWRGGLKPLLAKPSSVVRNRHHPALSWAEVPTFLAELRDENGNAARCLELCILTAVRSGEARGAIWGEFDLAGAIWTIPAGRMKAGEAHRVPLSAPALALLRAMLPAGDPPKPEAVTFPNRDGGVYSDMSILAVVKRMDDARSKAGGAGWRDDAGQRITPHGFRSTFRDWCGDQGHPRELAKAALAHATGSRTERAYARTDLLARRARLMDAWAAFCEGRAVEEATPLRVHAVA